MDGTERLLKYSDRPNQISDTSGRTTECQAEALFAQSKTAEETVGRVQLSPHLRARKTGGSASAGSRDRDASRPRGFSVF